jgi:hypothetical protein
MSFSTSTLKYEVASAYSRRMRAVLMAIAAANLALAPVPTNASADLAWERWQAVPGVFDLGGPRSDGSLVVAGSANLYLADPAGNVTPFARGPNGYHEDPGAEAYLAVARGAPASAAGCSFTRDDIFLLRLHAPPGIERVDAAGENTSSFANVTAVTSLNGIAFDTTGYFDHRLLASGVSGSKTIIAAIDCLGNVQVITSAAPTLEGGLAVAPPDFGEFGGSLIAPDEWSGNIFAIGADGAVHTIAKPALPTGGDVGVESLGFVPHGFMRGGKVYYADRLTTNNPHPGTDSVLRLSSSDLSTAGVQEGDLLVATEGGATLIAVHCDSSCKVIPVVTAPTTAHGEGHIVFTIDKVAVSPTPSTKPSPKPAAQSSRSTSTPMLLGLVMAAIVVVGVAVGLFARRRRG